MATHPISDKLNIVPHTTVMKMPSWSRYPYITLIVPIFDPNSLKLVGNLNIALSITEIQDILGQTRLGRTGFFLLSIQQERSCIIRT